MRRSLPVWSLAVLGVLFGPVVLVHEQVFGDSVGLIAAGAGVAVGLGLAWAAARWSWDLFTTATATVAAYLVFGGVAALRETTLFGVVPTARTLQQLVIQAAFAWKDLLTLAPPAADYTGPAVLPWLVGLICALVAGLLTLRGRALAGVAPVLVMAVIGVAWGSSSWQPPVWAVAGWAAAVLGWCAWAQPQRQRATSEALIIDPAHRSRHVGRRIIAGLSSLALAVAAAVPIVAAVSAFDSRVVLRDLVEPPLDVQDYPSPLAAFRHYTTDRDKQTLVTLSSLPEGARVRLAVMDTYNGIAFGMSSPNDGAVGRYQRVGATVRERPYEGTGSAAEVQILTQGLVGPWLPTLGVTDRLAFAASGAESAQAGLHVNRWADALLTTSPPSDATYTVHAVVPPVWSDGQLAGAPTGGLTGTPDTQVPEAVSALAQEVTAKELTQLGRARAIERYLAKNGFFSNVDAPDSRPGHRVDRLSRMLAAKQLIGDDEQYATVMALMLHSIGIPARVVMGLYPEAKPAAGRPVTLRGYDVHAWVEVPFEGVGWATFDPTPPRDQVPQTDVSQPRSVPRPQVLQPPEPPEQPVELPPSVTERPSGEQTDPPAPLPWGLIAGISAGVLAVIVPIVALVLAKRLRTRRRQAAEPGRAVIGAWDEIVDLADDAGVRVSPDLTRQESARALQPLWDPEAPSDARPAGVDWRLVTQREPGLRDLAGLADAASFAPEPTGRDEAADAWQQAGDLAVALAGRVGWPTRVRRRLSLRSLRGRRR